MGPGDGRGMGAGMGPGSGPGMVADGGEAAAGEAQFRHAAHAVGAHILQNPALSEQLGLGASPADAAASAAAGYHPGAFAFNVNALMEGLRPCSGDHTGAQGGGGFRAGARLVRGLRSGLLNRDH
jgi:hypothetical protein